MIITLTLIPLSHTHTHPHPHPPITHTHPHPHPPITHTHPHYDGQDGVWVSVTVLRVNETQYTVQIDGDGTTTVVSVSDVRGEPSTTYFKIEKFTRSVTLSHNGKRNRKLHDCHYQWSLTRASTKDRLVWSGGGYKKTVQIVWTRKHGRTATQSAHLVPLPIPVFGVCVTLVCVCGVCISVCVVCGVWCV